MALYVGLFFLARMAEHNLNKSVIRSNHIHIFKFDSAIALVIIVISIFGMFLTSTNKTKESMFQNFDDTEIAEIVENKDDNFKMAKQNVAWSNFTTGLKNLGSLLTGERNVFASGNDNFKFGMVDAPGDFDIDMEKPDDSDFDLNNSDFELRGGDGRRNDIDFSVDNLPLEYMSSSIFSTINTVLIFSVSAVGLLSLVAIAIKKHKFNREMNEVIYDGTIEMLDLKELERILSFGEDIEEPENLSNKTKNDENLIDTTNEK
jgi:hypothetical protein